MWCGIGPEDGRRVPECDAYEYAKAHLDEMPEKDTQLFVEFFFSGTWVKEGDDDAEAVSRA